VKRIQQKFSDLKAKKQCAFVAYICAGDPDFETSLAILKNLPAAGVDLIEVGVPFLDPAGDGIIIENAAKRAIAAGMTLKKTLEMVASFRETDSKTPLILMTYFNPILKYGLNKIFTDAQKSGVDGILIVDLPLEEEQEILGEIALSNLDSIRLITPTTNQARAKKISKNASGFLYLVSMLGITGTKVADISENQKNLQSLRQVSKLPIAIGFGIKTPKQAGEFAKIGTDGVVIGSTLVKEISDNFLNGKSSAEIVAAVTKKVAEFSAAIHNKN
jgi:tryptophan synthase alpha chain